MIAIIDYGLGKIKALVHVYKQQNIPVVIAAHPDQLREAGKIILPGLGSFDYAMQRLRRRR